MAELTQDPRVFIAFISPSGDGIKVILKVTDITPEQHKIAFKQCVEMFQEDYGFKVDISGSDANRLCYLAHYPQIHINHDARIINIDTSTDSDNADSNSNRPPSNHKPDSTEIAEMLKYIDADDYNTWLHIGMALKELGQDISLWDTYSQKSNKYEPGICQEKWDSFKREDGEKVGYTRLLKYATAGGYTPPKKEQQPKTKKGRPSRAEQAQKVGIPPEINDKPTIMLQEIQPVDNEIVIAERSREVVSDEVSHHLWRNGKVRLYRRGKELGSLRPSEDGLLFYPSSKASLGGDIARTVSLIKYGHDGKPTQIANAPGWLAEDILLNQDINDVPQIKVILTHPFYNGSNIADQHGYDTESQVFLDCENGIKFDLDTQAHTAADDLNLWRELLRDFHHLRMNPIFRTPLDICSHS